MLEQRGRCALCSDLMKPAGQLIDRPNLDHILPIALGGPDTASNLRLVHHHCNMLRAAFEHQGKTTPKDYQRAHRSLSKNWVPPAVMFGAQKGPRTRTSGIFVFANERAAWR
jgi:5-methylcytosine-specific restriction endonuclease McrA